MNLGAIHNGQSDECRMLNVRDFVTLAGRNRTQYFTAMKLAEIEQEALGLSDRERAALAAKLLDTLPPPGTDITDEEVEQRERELESGEVSAISHEEFIRGVRQQRGR